MDQKQRFDTCTFSLSLEDASKMFVFRVSHHHPYDASPPPSSPTILCRRGAECAMEMTLENCTVELCSGADSTDEPSSAAMGFSSFGTGAFLSAPLAGVVVATLGKAL